MIVNDLARLDAAIAAKRSAIVWQAETIAHARSRGTLTPAQLDKLEALVDDLTRLRTTYIAA